MKNQCYSNLYHFLCDKSLIYMKYNTEIQSPCPSCRHKHNLHYTVNHNRKQLPFGCRRETRPLSHSEKTSLCIYTEACFDNLICIDLTTGSDKTLGNYEPDFIP